MTYETVYNLSLNSNCCILAAQLNYRFNLNSEHFNPNNFSDLANTYLLKYSHVPKLQNSR